MTNPFDRSNWTIACNVCNDSGFVQAIHRETKTNYTFRCGKCEAPKNLGLSESIPMWTSHSKSKFESLNEFNKREGWKVA